MGENSSSAVLKYTNKSSRVYKAFLISEFQTNGNDEEIKKQFNIPMTLRGPKGDEITAYGIINGKPTIYL